MSTSKNPLAELTAEQADAREKSEILIEALPWMQRFAGKIVVVKYGGNAMIDEDLRRAFAASSSRLTASRSFTFFSSSAGGSGGASDTRCPARCTSHPSVIRMRLLDRRAPASSSSSSLSSLPLLPPTASSRCSSSLKSSSSSAPNPPGTPIFLRAPALMTRAPAAALLRLLCAADGRPWPMASDLRLGGRRAA